MKTAPSSRFLSVRPLVGSIAVALLAQAVSAQAATSSWSSTTSGGLWSATGNWTGSSPASGASSTADFNHVNIATDPFVVHLDSAVTIGNLIFGDTDGTNSVAGWTLDNNGNAANVLTLDNGGSAPTITVNQLGVANVNYKAATISAVIAGTSGLVKAGVGQLTLSGTNTYTGVTTVSAGILDFAQTASLYGGTSTNWTPSNITVASGATFAVNVGGTGEFATTDVTTLLANLLVSNGTGLKAGSSFGIDTTNAGALGVTYSGVIGNSTGTSGGAIGLVKLGTGQLSLTGANTYTGMTQVLGGVLDIGTITSGSNSVGVSGSSGILLNNGSVLQANGTLTRALSGNLTPGAGQIAAYNGGFAARGGQLTVNLGSVGNSVASAIALNGGYGWFGGGLVFGSTTSDNKVLFQNSINLNTGAGNTRSVSVVTGANALGSTAEISGYIVSGSASSLGPDGGLTKNGTGTLLLSASNNYSGVTVVNAGTLQIGHSAALGTGGVTDSTGAAGINSQAANNLGGTFVNSGATLDLNGQTNVNEIINLNGTGVGGNGALVNNSATAASIGNGVAFITATGGSNSSLPSITISGGGGTGATAASVKYGVSAQNFTITGNTTTWTTAPTVTIGGGGTGGAALSGSSTSIATAHAVLTNGTISAIVIDTKGDGYTTAPTITFSGGTKNVQGTDPTVVGNATGFAVDVQLTNSGSGYTSAPTVTFGSGAANSGSATLSQVVLGGNSSIGGTGNITINPTISGAYGVTKVGAGTLTLSGSNSYTGTTTISGGVVNLSNTNALANSTLTTTSAGSLVFDSSVSGHAFTFGGLAATSAGVGYDIALQDNAATPNAVALTVGNNNATASYAGVLSGSGSLTKVGTGTQTLSGANTYTGVTTINGGTLTFSKIAALYGGSSANWTPTNIIVNSGGTLAVNVGGTGEFSGTDVGTLLTNLTSGGG